MNSDADIFAKVVNHMLTGVMFHDQMYQFFLFLRLYSFAKDHKKRYEEESKAYHKINKYYITHRNKLIETRPVKPKDYIPNEWYKLTRFESTPEDMQKAVSYGVDAWSSWEADTKGFYTDCYNDLMHMGFAAEADVVLDLVKDVDKELSEAESLKLYLEAIKYDVVEIMEMNK